MNKKLDAIIDDFNELRENFRTIFKTSEVKRDTLLEFQTRLVELKCDLTPWHKKVAAEYEKRSDKAATAIKYRICSSISNGEFIDIGDTNPLEKCSLNQAEKIAASTKRYKEFLDQRAFYRESLVNVVDLREDINSYINLIKDMLKQ